MRRPRLGSCGETSETTAAWLHGVVALLSTLACLAAVAFAAVFHLSGAYSPIVLCFVAIAAFEAVMALWHWKSVGVHNRRAQPGSTIGRNASW